MRPLVVLAIALVLAGSGIACGGAGSPSPINAPPAVTSPATPLPSPAGTGGYDYGY
jgi:hypothetical protein